MTRYGIERKIAREKEQRGHHEYIGDGDDQLEKTLEKYIPRLADINQRHMLEHDEKNDEIPDIVQKHEPVAIRHRLIMDMS